MCLFNRMRYFKASTLLFVLLALTLPTHAAGILRITEAMTNGDIVDWFEVTNVGDAAVNISGYKVDDSSYAFGTALALNGKIGRAHV